ncbi:MAG: nucleotidyltransferase family protein [Ardenticatenia bacterium]|nr:nucleotidyltransferase family protein [Ardenticatenia bacterium]
MEGRSPLASAPFSLPMTQLPRHPPTVLDGPARRALLSWLWAAAQPDPRRWPPAPPPPMAWSDLATLAEGHGLAAMVLEAAQAQADPAEALVSQGLARLMDAADRTLTRGRRLATEQATLEKALLRQGLPFAWLKGGWLTEASLYPDPAARPRADLDLFAPEPFWPGLAEVLQGLGYRAAQRSWKHAVWLNADHRVVDLRGEHPDNPRTVEVHAWLGEGFRGLRLDLSAEVAPLRPAQHLTRGLALAHLAAHTSVAMLERRLRLVQLMDLALLADQLRSEDLEQLRGIGSRRHAARFLWPSLALTARLAPAPALRQLVAALEPAVSGDLRGWLATQDVDGLSWPGRDAARRPLLEIPRIWPADHAELLTVWRSILLPPPELLADRYPELAAEGRHVAMFVRHLGFTLRRAVRRWRQRPR